MSGEHVNALRILMQEGVHFEGIIEKQKLDFCVPIQATGYTWTSKNELFQRLKHMGIDFINAKSHIHFGNN